MHTMLLNRSRSEAPARLLLGLLMFCLSVFIAKDLHAQTMMPIPPHSSTYTSSMIRGFWFQAPTDFRIVGVRVPTDASTAAQNIQVFKLGCNPAICCVYSTLTTNYTTLGYWTNVNSTAIIPCDILVQTGDYIGIVGARGTNGGTLYNSYDGPSPWQSSIFGNPVNITRFGHQGGNLPITGGVWTELTGSICRVEIYYAAAVTVPNDVGIASIDSPVNFCAGMNDVKVTLKNFGTNQVTSAQIHWSVNGVPQPTNNWSGLLDTLNQTTRQTQVTLGTMNLQSGVPYTFTAWTAMPNGVQDTMISNDTASYTGKAALSGTFTIGGASPDYPTFADAVKDLKTLGLCGPVVFNVRSGTYTEQVELSDIAGTSAVNTVTFQSESANPATVNLTYSATSSASNYVISMGDSKFITFKDMTVTATGASYGRAVEMGTSTDGSFINCELISPNINTTSSSYYAVVYSASGVLNHRTTFENCGIREGTYGMYMYGSSSASRTEDLTVKGCEFTGQAYYLFYGPYTERLTFHDNRLIQTAPVYLYAQYLLYLSYPGDFSIERNWFFSDEDSYTRYLVYIYAYNNQGTSNRFVNNFLTNIHNNASYWSAGLILQYGTNLLVAHNTFYVSSSLNLNNRCVESAYGSNQRWLNNIFYATGGNSLTVWHIAPSAVSEMDYNVYYSDGPNFVLWDYPAYTACMNVAELQAASGMAAHAIEKTVTFKDVKSGDLHLAGASENDSDLFGLLLNEVPEDIDNDVRVNPYRGADEACYVLPGSLTYAFVDRQGQPTTYVEAPGTIGVQYGVSFPEYAATVTFTVQFYDPFTSQLVYQTSFSASKQYGVPLQGTQYITLPATLPPGPYRVEVIFHTKNSCDVYSDYMPYATALLVVPEGRVPCIVWPGDANNDGVVTYADRRALNMYIYDANLRTTWLSGPRRYQVDEGTNPFTYLEWKPQPATPWYTLDGCYMDTDGNGVINNLDYIAMKLNWSKMTPWFGGPPKAEPGAAGSFAMDQNYPNPFNPTTVIRYSLPEASDVHLVILDALGHVVTDQEYRALDKGVHEYTFDGSGLSSGMYVATMTMTSIASGATYTKTIKMALMR